MRSVRRWTLRLLAAGLMMAGLTGPAPGNVGGCGATASVADPVNHCTDRENWICQRDRFAGRIENDTDFTNCLADVESTCSGASWPAGCSPTQAQSDACINLLRRGELVHLTTDELLAMYDDCNLCQ